MKREKLGELRYSREALPALKTLDEGQQVIYLGSFSKVLSPGLRVSALIAPDGVMEKLVFAKQAADLHTDNLAQRIVYEFLFLWVTLLQGVDALKLFEKAIQAKVAYVPGSCYYANGGGENSLRVNFSACDKGKIEIGIQRLAKVITENLK